MPRYFFDTFSNGHRTPDDIGAEFDTLDKMRLEAMSVLPAIAKDEVAQDGDSQAFTVLVKDEDQEPVYSATLTFAGLWLRPDHDT